MKKKNEFLVTCIIPCWNVELYIEDAIESVINQTIGFENIELILVNDGSKDNTLNILKKYEKKYPDNIVVLDQENSGGASAPRNNGLKIARGKYLSFLDGDDTWDYDAFEKGAKMLDNHPEIDFVSFRVYQFEGVEKYHMLDYKYDSNKIVDVLEEPTMIQSLVSSMLYRTKFVSQFRFDGTVKYSEDVKFVCELLFKNSKYGLISDSNYNQRKRLNETSTVQTCLKDPKWYTHTIKQVYDYLEDKSLKKYKKYIDFVQLSTLCEFQWRFFTNKDNVVLEEKELKEYYKALVRLLKKCDDKNILLTAGANDYKRRKMLEIKHGGIIYDKFKVKGNDILFNKTKVMSLDDLYIRLIDIKVTRRFIKLLFKFNMFVTKELDIYVNGKKYTCKKALDNSNLIYEENEFLVDVLNYKTLYAFRKSISIYTIIDGVKCPLDIKIPNAKYRGLKINKKGKDLVIKAGIRSRLLGKIKKVN